MDTDGDLISDEYEKANEEASWRYDDEFGMNKWFDGWEILKDPEMDAVLRGDWTYAIGSNDSKDWSHIGKQSWKAPLWVLE